MPKISERDVRSLRRQVACGHGRMLQLGQELGVTTTRSVLARAALRRCKTSMGILLHNNRTLCQNIKSLHGMFLKQQQVIREQKATIRTFALQNDTNSPSDINDVVAAMVAMGQQ